MSSCCANVFDCLFVVSNVFFLNFVLPFDGEIKLYIKEIR